MGGKRLGRTRTETRNICDKGRASAARRSARAAVKMAADTGSPLALLALPKDLGKDFSHLSEEHQVMVGAAKKGVDEELLSALAEGRLKEATDRLGAAANYCSLEVYELVLATNQDFTRARRVEHTAAELVRQARRVDRACHRLVDVFYKGEPVDNKTMESLRDEAMAARAVTNITMSGLSRLESVLEGRHREVSAGLMWNAVIGVAHGIIPQPQQAVLEGATP